MYCFIAFFYLQAAFTGSLVNEELITSVVERSSPSHIIATKGSSLRLHWNYSYVGDGGHNEGKDEIEVWYREQQITVNSTSQTEAKTLASRTGSSGVLALVLPVPPEFSGRVEVISSNSSVVICNLQYNDSSCQFSSVVKVDVGFSGNTGTITYLLKPDVSITVNGIPDFIERPPINLDVAEDSDLKLKVEMDGNPQPSADFRWPHLTGSSPTNVRSE